MTKKLKNWFYRKKEVNWNKPFTWIALLRKNFKCKFIKFQWIHQDIPQIMMKISTQIQKKNLCINKIIKKLK